MTSKAAGLQRAPINEDMLRGIYASDQNMYPAPFAFERLHSWVTACPELSICFTTTAKDNGEGDDAAPVPVGVVVVLPLQKKYWDALIVGKVKEFDIAAAMFASEESGDEDVGLHVFHIERFDSGRPLGSRLPGFAPTALEEVRELAMGKRWNVLGYSALTATPAGRAVFQRMGFKPTGYKEIFPVPENGKFEIIFLYPGQDEPGYEARDRASKSEMVARHSSEAFWRGV